MNSLQREQSPYPPGMGVSSLSLGNIAGRTRHDYQYNVPLTPEDRERIQGQTVEV